MQFIPNGPDVPEGMLQAHEEGRLVFFCGAGISYPAGLPDFSGLVDRLYCAVGEPPNALQQEAIRQRRYDTAIGLLEDAIAGSRQAVRREVAKILTPDPAAPDALLTHEALLRLAENRDGRVRLVTTNFDRVFQLAIARRNRPIQTFSAPFLPTPKNRWDGLVYLHGVLEEEPTLAGLNQLVLSSGDFGLAYLTERWAARFVSELFRSFSVCFVGYSIEDPVLRYMMDALAADRMLGETPPEMFAFGGVTDDLREEVKNGWQSKNVTPILYLQDAKHTLLHGTLREWSLTFRDGVRGKEHIVVSAAMSRPSSSTAQDNFVGRVLWALSDPSGLPAKAFAEFEPPPSLEWLGSLCDPINASSDLIRFGISAAGPRDLKLRFSFLNRPAPHTHAPHLALADSGTATCTLDAPLKHLARWLTCHLDDAELILWIAKQGGRLHPEFAWLINHRLDQIDANKEIVEHRKSSASSGVLRPGMRVLWRLALAGRLKTPRGRLDVLEWVDRFKRDGMTPSIRMELRSLLSPCVAINKPFRMPGHPEVESKPERAVDIVRCELELTADDIHIPLRDVRGSPAWKVALPSLLPDATMLLRDAMDLMWELGGVNDKSDLSYVHHHSIADHPQNRDYRDWTALIDLARDAWLELFKHEPARARQVATGWWSATYPVFKRLALFAAAQGDVIPFTDLVGWLLEDDAWFLWSVEVRREALRVIAVRSAANPDPAALKLLEEAILKGPPRRMYRDDIEPDKWTELVAREKWHRLMLIRSAGAPLQEKSVRELEAIASEHTAWRLADDQRDEFPVWSGSGWVGTRKPWLKQTSLPRGRPELLAHLRARPEPAAGEEDDWAELCGKKFRITAWALCSLARAGVWPMTRWREALQAWMDAALLRRSWRYLAPTVTLGPDELLTSLASSLSWWVRGIAKNVEVREQSFLGLCHRILSLDMKDSRDVSDPVGAAINHPFGQIAEALLQWWYSKTPVDGQGLPQQLKLEFDLLCSSASPSAHHGRVLLAAHVISLFRVDPDWTVRTLLPFFDWNRSEGDAREAWEGFLWSPRLHAPLLRALAGSLLETSRHVSQLGKHARQYATLLTFVALELPDVLATEQLAAATRALPNDALGDVADALVQGLTGAGDKASEYLTHRIVPYLRTVWPKGRKHISGAVAEAFARLCIAARDKFSEAFDSVKDWLMPLEHSEHVVHLLEESGLCSRFPETALALLDKIVDERASWPSPKIKACLEQVIKADPALSQHRAVERLTAFLRSRGYG